MGLRMCSGTEHVHMEMLENTANNRFGSLNNDPVGDVRRGFLPKSSSKNTRGTRIARPRFCKGHCCALPGDTISWCSTDYGYPESYKYEPATQKDLIERGFINMAEGFTGILTQQAKLARDDTSQLESDNEDDDDESDGEE
eukprot:scaffold10092_cov123-Amphora_coffeaeformis.AAC.3